jgi:type I restriction enzyme S subunit
MIDTIVNSFDIWVDAQGIKSRTRVKSVDNISLEGLEGLRQLILELAVTGKLVSQDPKDEPAVVILERIANTNAQLFKEGKISTQKQITKISKEEVPFELPKGWEWARLPQISDFNTGRTPSTDNPAFWSNKEDGFPWISISDMPDYGYIREASKYISKEASEKVFSLNPAPVGTILMSFKLTIGKISILEIEAYHNEAIISIIPYDGIFKEYLFKVLPKRAKKGNSKNALMGNTLNAKSLALLLVPIPPFAEQKRIVAKVDELMALCDKLEAEQFNNLKTHQVLVKTVLENLTQAADANELQAAWERMSAHFDTLFCTDDSIEQLKQTILQLAVMGKLVKQDLNDETASELLKKIAKAKEKLIKEGELKEQIPLPVITEQEKPHKLPENWEWCRLGEITLISRGSSPRPKGDPRYFSNVETDYNWITISDITNFCKDNILYKTREHLTKEGAPLSRYVEKDVFIIAVSGSTTGKCCITGITGYIYDGLASVNFIEKSILNDYFILYMLQYYQHINTSVEGLFPNINTDFLKNLMFCIPPKSEQKRIVTKVNELFALCESLKEKVQKSQDIKVLLSKTIVEKAVQ